MNAISNRADMLATTGLLHAVSPDADLIAACNEYLRIQRAFEVACAECRGDMEADNPAVAILEPARRLAEVIVALRATTAEGYLARACCAAHGYLPHNRVCQDDIGAAMQDRFKAACLRDVVQMLSGKPHFADAADLGSSWRLGEASADVPLIHLAADHAANVIAINHSPEPIEDDDAKWDRYFSSQNLMAEARPCTMAGVYAVARAIRAEAELTDGKFDGECQAGMLAAWEFVLRLAGHGETNAEPAVAGIIASPDAALLAACAEFDKLEDAYTATFTKGNPAYIKNDEKRRKVYWPLVERQQEIAPIIADTPAHTASGVIAKLRTFAKWDLEILKPDGAERNVAETILSSACRDVMRGFGA